MLEESKEILNLTFEKERTYINNQMGDELWIKVYDYYDNGQNINTFYSGLIKNQYVRKALENTNWEVSITEGIPNCTRFGNDTIEYSRFGHAQAEPLVFVRDYIGFRDSHVEISEEFRFFHNLYYEKARNEYIKFDESGGEETIIKFQNGAVLIRRKEICQFLAIKECHLALFFDYIHYSYLDLSSIPENKRRDEYKNGSIIYLFVINEAFPHNQYHTVSHILGKKLIPPYPKSKSGIWPYCEDETEIYEEFQIGETADGDPISFTCDPSKLANYFGANPNAPNYLTPVYFKRDVLQKYYGDSERFSVEDSYLRCGDSWGLRMDNHHTDIVIVYLGDLGQYLPAKERLYWKVFNIAPKGKLSETKYMRDFLGMPCDPQGIDLRFKQRYQQLNRKWESKYGWTLFRQLVPEDSHYFQNLRVPINNSQSEFDSQILALTKIMIDALNEKEISKNILDIPDKAQGITKFELFLEQKQIFNYSEGVSLFRNIQDIRSTGVAHLKGSKYSKLIVKFDFSNKELQQVFSDLLNQLIIFFENLISVVDLE